MTGPQARDSIVKQESPTITDSFWLWLKIGLLSFGGPAGQMALMHREIVERKGWLSEKQYLNALGFCMLLPGPEAMQLATYAGWRIHGVLGGLIAGLLFVIPGALVILALATGYVMFGTKTLVGAVSGHQVSGCNYCISSLDKGRAARLVRLASLADRAIRFSGYFCAESALSIDCRDCRNHWFYAGTSITRHRCQYR